MAREFNFQLNENVMKNLSDKPVTDDEELTRVLKVGDDIFEVFRKHDVSMSDAYLILTSMADSIYMYSLTRDGI